ncbi:MAG: efflux transporter outer membrane subunit [FCB group bacterium]|jgi:multidrug efflux system outer membrane protein|nr:efflux transporter outer membrane subunit [FCB group bacterium]
MCNKATFWVGAAMTLLLAGCVTGPDYRRPELNTPTAYKSATPAETAPPDLTRDWWRLFNDSELNALAEEAVSANQELKAAIARVEQSRASARSVKSAFFPVVTLDPSANRARTPGSEAEDASLDEKLSQASSKIGQVTNLVNSLNSTTGGGAASSASALRGLLSDSSTNSDVPATTSSRYQVPFDLSYEIDIWGRVQRSYESAQAQAQATVYDLEVVRQTLLADLARNYFNLRSFDAQYEILTRNLALYQEQVDLTSNQYIAGLISETNLLQAQVQLESTRAQAADTLRQRTDLEHAIAILLGRAPAQFTLDPRPLDATPPVVPAGMPADILLRRPDVAEAEQNLVSASAEIGVAQAEFFPSVKLTGSAGFQSSDIKSVLDWSNRTWSLGPSVSVPLFKGGQLKANLQQARARYDELEASYRQTVLSAFVDVEDALTDLHMRADAAEAQAKAVAAAREYLRLTQIEYQSGVVDYLNVVNAEQTLINNELTEAQILNQRMVSTVLLMKALGGGWQAG